MTKLGYVIFTFYFQKEKDMILAETNLIQKNFTT